MLLASKVDSLLSTSTVNALIAEVGCLQVGAGDTLAVSLTSSASCGASSSETVNTLGGTATVKYFIKLRANVVSAGHSVLERQIIAVGEVRGSGPARIGLYQVRPPGPHDVDDQARLLHGVHGQRSRAGHRPRRRLPCDLSGARRT